MSTSCTTFRELLEGALLGQPDPASLTGLSFHEHLLGCSSCRDLLQTEEALEMLLASWPRPELSAELSARLVERLREARKLEELLDLADPPGIPEGLADRVLHAVAPERERVLDTRLDAWLDLAGEVQVPVGLSARVTSALRVRAREGLRVRRMFTVRSLAAALLAALTLTTLWRLSDADRAHEPGRGLELAMAVPSDELLSALPVLENWEVLFGESDLDLATGMDFSAEDEALLDFADVNPARTEGAGEGSYR